MSNYTYTWNLLNLRVADSGSLQSAIVQTHWQLTGTDQEGYFGVFNGATPFSLFQINSGSFIPFEQLKEEDVLGWIKQQVYGGYKQHIDEMIQKQIDRKRNHFREVPFPWTSGSL